MSIGTNIKRLREAAGMSQVELAKRLDVSRGAVGMWEVDTTIPRMPKVEAMAKLFGVSSSAILFGDSYYQYSTAELQSMGSVMEDELLRAFRSMDANMQAAALAAVKAMAGAR